MLLVSLVFILSASACTISFGGDSEDKKSEEAEEASAQDEANDEETEDGEQAEDNASDNEADDTEQNETDSDADDNEQSEQQDNTKEEQSLPEPIVLNERIEHPIGVIFELEEITFEENHILVSFTAENHSGSNQFLAIGGRAHKDSLGGITLEDDTGFFYRYNAGAHANLPISDRERITAKVSFTGRIKDDAQFITLKFNEGEELEFIFEDLELIR